MSPYTEHTPDLHLWQISESDLVLHLLIVVAYIFQHIQIFQQIWYTITQLYRELIMQLNQCTAVVQ